MPKVKSHRGAAKRLRKTGGKEIRRGKANKSHILTKKTTTRKRKLRAGGVVDATNRRAVLRLLPY